jgi:hypothetical protein
MLSAWVYVPYGYQGIQDIVAIMVNTINISKLLTNQHLSFCPFNIFLSFYCIRT